MKLDLIDTVLSSFNRIASRASLAVLGGGIALLAIIFAGAALTGALATVSGAVAGIAGLVTFAVYLAGVAALTVGSLRAFDQKDFNKAMFTENIFWPFLRMTGSNIVTQTFAFTIAYALMLPIILVGSGLGAVTAGSLGAGGLSGGLLPLAGLLGLIAVFLILYVMGTLMISLPRIAINNKRMFEALDESVQSTRGSRPRIVLSFIPFALLIGLGMGSIVTIGGITGSLVYGASLLIGGLYMLALLTELNNRLQ